MEVKTHEGRVAVVTGATGGFGQALCVDLATRGADIVAIDIEDSAATVKTVERLNKKIISIVADIADPSATKEVGATIRSNFGRCDILINNAGIYPRLHFSDLDYGTWRRTLAVNVDSQFLMTKAVVDLMKDNNWGRIVNITTDHIAQAAPAAAHFLSSKMGVNGFTRGLATDLAGFGITVNAVGPGVTPNRATATIGGLPASVVEATVAMQAIKRPSRTNDVVGVVAFLSSGAAAFITGQTIMADGGLARL
jgi:3-oxoacyl-[acyl-carrier protein] reductase